MSNHKVPPFCYGVIYTWHGAKTKSIFLTKDRAELYVMNLRLDDARIVRCYDEDSIEFLEKDLQPEPQIKRISSEIILESTEVDGVIVCNG